MPKKRKSKNWQILWTEEGLDSLWDGWTFIAAQNEDRADRMIEKTQERVATLIEHPFLGPLVPELENQPFEYHQLVIHPWPYRVIYRIEEYSETIWILRVHPTKIPLEWEVED